MDFNHIAIARQDKHGRLNGQLQIEIMSSSDTVPENGQAWESAHVCPNCGHVINLAELDMQALTTGIVTCPSCDWSGQIEIQVVDHMPRKKPG
jgi:predicted RNA-binding Zn-ribbon protein involved in translation (DUF1610 family)